MTPEERQQIDEVTLDLAIEYQAHARAMHAWFEALSEIRSSPDGRQSFVDYHNRALQGRFEWMPRNQDTRLLNWQRVGGRMQLYRGLYLARPGEFWSLEMLVISPHAESVMRRLASLCVERDEELVLAEPGKNVGYALIESLRGAARGLYAAAGVSDMELESPRLTIHPGQQVTLEITRLLKYRETFSPTLRAEAWDGGLRLAKCFGQNNIIHRVTETRNSAYHITVVIPFAELGSPGARFMGQIYNFLRDLDAAQPGQKRTQEALAALQTFRPVELTDIRYRS